MSTAIVTSDTSINHETGLGHPEKPDRVTTIIKNLKKNKNLIWKKNKKFDQKFIELARSVYITNDKRAEIKLEINNKFGSKLVEVKSYVKY